MITFKTFYFFPICYQALPCLVGGREIFHKKDLLHQPNRDESLHLGILEEHVEKFFFLSSIHIE